MRVCVLTVSDSSYTDHELDKSGPRLVELLRNSAKLGAEIVDRSVVPDEREQIVAFLRENAKSADCILTTGGTGFAKRDVTPEATREVIQRECHGIVTALLVRGLQSTPLAALTRLTAGIVDNCLIVNLPGSPRAVQEGFEVLESMLLHAVSVLKNDTAEIAGTHAKNDDRVE